MEINMFDDNIEERYSLAIERISERQKVSNISENDIDVIGIARNELEVCIEIFFVRGSQIMVLAVMLIILKMYRRLYCLWISSRMI